MVVVKLNGFLFARGGLATKQNKGARTTEGGLFVSDVFMTRVIDSITCVYVAYGRAV